MPQVLHVEWAETGEETSHTLIFQSSTEYICRQMGIMFILYR